MFKMTLTLSLLLLGAEMIQAQPSPSIVCNQDYFNATRYIGSRNSARLPNGSILVAFEPSSNYVNTEIWYTTWNDFFDEWDPPQQLSFSPGSSTGIPALVATEEGQIWASWKELNQEGDRDVASSIWDGGSWSAPMVADVIENNAGVNTIDVASDGTIFNLFSIWNDPADYEANIYSSRTTNQGETWVTDNLTATFPTPDVLPLNYMDVSLCPGPDGTMYAAWEDKPYDASWEILLSRFDDGTWSEPAVITPIEDQDGILKYVDACTPTEDAEAIYEMGPEDYALAGGVTAVLNPNPNHPVFSCFFNLRYIGEEAQLDQLTSDVLAFLPSSEIIFVDDDNRYDHEEYLTASLDRVGATYTSFDCGQDTTGVAALPSADDLAGNDLVIWFCGDDGGNLALWNALEEDNEVLISYLNDGGALWLIGIDALYDRYPSTPTTFEEGDFCYDYLGLASYDAQSWSDDGEVGVSQLDPTDSQTLTEAGVLTWSVTGAIRQGEPSLALTPDGMLHMSYVEEAHMYYMNSMNGTSWSQPIQVDVAPDSLSCFRPCMAADADYGLYITWNQEQTLQPHLTNIYYATSPDGGVTWNQPEQLSFATEGNSYGNSVFKATIGRKVRPPITDLFDGGADVTWVQWNVESELGYDIMYGRIPYAGTGTSVADPAQRPTNLGFVEAYPNPFNPSTEIRFNLNHGAKTTVEIYNLQGALVDLLFEGELSAGEHGLTWHANGHPSGLYLLNVQAGNENKTQKLSLLR